MNAPSGVGRCRLVIFVVPSGLWTAPSGVGRWLFHGVCFLGNFLLARCFLFLFCGEGMTAGHRLWFVLPVRRGKGLSFQCQSFACGRAVCSGLFLAGISWSVRGAILNEGCLGGDYSLHFCAWSQLASCFWCDLNLYNQINLSASTVLWPTLIIVIQCSSILWNKWNTINNGLKGNFNNDNIHVYHSLGASGIALTCIIAAIK